MASCGADFDVVEAFLDSDWGRGDELKQNLEQTINEIRRFKVNGAGVRPRGILERSQSSPGQSQSPVFSTDSLVRASMPALVVGYPS